jgi:hypothetical protein
LISYTLIIKLVPETNHTNGFIISFSLPSLEFNNSQLFGGNSQDVINDIFPFEDCLYIVGTTSSTKLPGCNEKNPRSTSAFVSCFTTSEEISWTKFHPLYFATFGNSICVDLNGNIIICGYTNYMNSKETPFTYLYPPEIISPSKIGFISLFENNGTLLSSTDYSDCVLQDVIKCDDSIFTTGMAWEDFYVGDDHVNIQKCHSYTSLIQLSMNGTHKKSIVFGGTEILRETGFSLKWNPMNDSLYIVGQAFCSDFPLTENAFQKTQADELNAFFVEYDLSQ